jgi:hypothetical protein
MRTVVVGACMLAAACSGQGLDSPTAPSGSTGIPFASRHIQAQSGSELPFHGSFTGSSFSCFRDGTCPPGTLIITQHVTGEATHLGQFTAVAVSTGDFPPTGPPTATGTWDFISANGDRLSATTIGGEDQFIPPNISHVSATATIVGGTGRFAAATGTFTIRFVSTIDFASATASATGSFEGHINLNR